MLPDTWNMKTRLYASRHLVAILSVTVLLVMMAIKQEATENKVSCSRRQ